MPAMLLIASACSDDRSNGTISDSDLVAEPGTIDFGYTAPNDFSGNETIELINMGSSTINITDISSSAQSFSLYQVPAAYPASVSAGQSEVISVYFSPASAGNFVGTIEVEVEGADEPLLVLLGGCSTSTDCVVDWSDLDVPVGDDDDGDDDDGGDDDDSVDPSGGDIEVNPASVSFGDVAQNQAPVGDVITISNVGSGPLVVSDIAISGTDASLFTVGGYAGGTVQPNGAPVNLTLSFDPGVSIEGAKVATLTILSNDEDEPTLTIPLTAEVTADCGACVPTWTIVGASSMLDLGIDLGSLLGGGMPGLPGGSGGGSVPGMDGPLYLQVSPGTVDVTIQNTGSGAGTLSSVTEGGTLMGMLPVADSPQVTYLGGAPLTLAAGETGVIQFEVSGTGMCEMVNLDNAVTFIMGTEAGDTSTLMGCMDLGGGGMPGLPF
jgi:hypothetical protein